jgi:hypothetical protein
VPRLRRVAALIRRLSLTLALAAAVAVALPATSFAQDGTPEPTPTRPPTCSDRFPAEGPAGVDLRLGCIVGELVGLYTASSRDEPPTLSAYVITLTVGVALGAVLVLVALRVLARRASRRLAPVLSSEWWICPSCQSVNATTATRCYACGGPPGDGPTMVTDADPTMAHRPGGPRRD